MTERIENLSNFLENSLTPYHARDNAKEILSENGFTPLSETRDWGIAEGGKYFVERGGSLIAFTVGGLDRFAYKIVAAHLDSPAVKIKENPDKKTDGGVVLNAEKYGGGLWYSFMDRPLKIAGQIVVCEDGRLRAKTAEAPFLVTIPSQAIHMNREANDAFSVNPQIDLLPLYSLSESEENFLQAAFPNEGEIVSYDLFAVSAEKPYIFGKDGKLFAAPRVDNLTSIYASLEGLLSCAESEGICVAAFFNHEEIGSRTAQGACGDFLENTLRRLAYALRFDDDEYDKALASSVFLSVDNAHAIHPNHPEKSDPTNRTRLGGGIVIKSHAGGAYITDALASAIVKKVLDKAGVPHQSFFNRSDMKSGSTLGIASLSRFGVYGADIGIAQLAMHSACECFAVQDYFSLADGLTAFFSSEIIVGEDGILIQ